MARKQWTRRRVLGASAAAAALALNGRRAFAQQAPAVRRGTRLTYWGGLIFSDRANRLQTETINKWGRDNGVTTEVVMVNQNETVRQVSAAMAANTMPDALDLGLSLLLLLARQNVLLPVDEVFNRVGQAQGGWYPSIADATDTVRIGAAGRTGVPFGASGNLLLRRKDVLERAGFTRPPATWVEMVEQSVRVNRPPLFAMGLALSNVGDGNTQVGVLQSYGGRIADNDGRRVTIKSDETRTYLRWVKDAWDRRLFPPGVTTWDGAGDNNAYLAGQAVFIANTGSVGIAARTQDQELYNSTLYSSLPAGPRGVVSPIDPQVRAIPRTSQNPEAAKELIEFLANAEYSTNYFKDAIYGPALKGQARLAAFTGNDPILAGLLDLVERGTAPGAPDVYNAGFADMLSNFIVPRMIQRVVVDSWDLDRAMDEAQTAAQAIYDRSR
jgi:multiple sugar transport system substrate-binding protein